MRRKFKNIPAKNCLTMSIIAKDLTVQQRDQNKKRRAEKIKQQQKALKEKKNQWTMRITQKI